jgi:hypothetical protein
MFRPHGSPARCRKCCDVTLRCVPQASLIGRDSERPAATADGVHIKAAALQRNRSAFSVLQTILTQIPHTDKAVSIETRGMRPELTERTMRMRIRKFFCRTAQQLTERTMRMRIR